jgi:protein involved in polysaccharide export with SLBB domain
MKRILLASLLALLLTIVAVAVAAPQQQNQPTDAVNIVGQVNMPGVYRVQDDHFSLVQAIKMAHGFTAYADARHVTITRTGAPTVTIDFRGVLNGSRPDIIIKAGDVIRVPELKR